MKKKSGRPAVKPISRRRESNVEAPSTKQSDVAHRAPTTKLKWREVWFIIPAKTTRSFFLELYSACESTLIELSEFRLRPILRCIECPSADEEDEVTVGNVLDREIRWIGKDNLAALVVAPTGHDSLEHQVAEFCRRTRKPVVPLTLPFQHLNQVKDDSLRTDGVKMLHTVAADGEAASAILGMEAAKRLGERRSLHGGVKATLTLLMIPGREGRTDSIERMKNFEIGFTNTINGFNAVAPTMSVQRGRETVGHHVDVITTSPCEWQKHIAAYRVEEQLIRGVKPDVVFAASDQMCLGACEVLSSKRWRIECDVYGFDCIDEVARRLHDPHERFLRGTVTQNFVTLARQLARVLSSELEELAHVREDFDGEFGREVRTVAKCVFWKGHPNPNTDAPPVWTLETKGLWLSEPAAAEMCGVETSTLSHARTEKVYEPFRRCGDDHCSHYGHFKRPEGKAVRFLAGTWREDIGKKHIFDGQQVVWLEESLEYRDR